MALLRYLVGRERRRLGFSGVAGDGRGRSRRRWRRHGEVIVKGRRGRFLIGRGGRGQVNDPVVPNHLFVFVFFFLVFLVRFP